MPRWPTALIVFAWTACIVLGTAVMMKYELTPGATLNAPSDWPAGTWIRRDASQPTLVLFLHPRCSCSRATLAELERLIAECDGRFTLRIAFVRPNGAGDDWEHTDLYQHCQRIAGAQLVCDIGGVEAARFRATTSGEALLYSSEGRLLFHGGLTASRGHEGDNAGHSALASLVASGQSTCCQTPVFGCSLVDRFQPLPISSHATSR